MKFRPAAFWLSVFLATAALQTGPAAAGPWRELHAAQGQPERFERGPQRQRDGGQPERFQRQERPQRLSDEERRELHRDLDKARREIYKPRRDR
ncbi:MAG: hypothetical protein K2X06_10525 [Burkholderiales bacterium]|nr:hypothetical protein [Burkholderiales bacterium]